MVKRIASLAILFVALTEFALERARFDLWIMTAAVATLLWNALGRALRSRVDSEKHDPNVTTTRK